MKIVVATLFLIPVIGFSQSKLSLSEAVDIALKKSFDIQIAKNNVQASVINNHIAMAGGLPTVTASITDQESVVNINQELNTGTKISRNGAASNNLSSNVTGTMVLYNGYKVKATKQRLEELQKQSQQSLNAQIQNTIALVYVSYYDVVKNQYYIKTIQQSIEVAKQRQSIIKTRKEIGLANNADVFQAEIDVNARLQDAQSQQLILQQSITTLLNVLALKPDSNIVITDTIVAANNIQLKEILDALPSNPQILTQGQQIKINELIEKETATLRNPTLRANAGVNYNRNQATGGQLLLNQSYGPFVGLNLSVPLYSSGNIKRQEQTAHLNTTNAKLQQQNLLNDLQTSVVKTYQTYSNSLKQLELQQQTFNVSSQLVSLTLQRFQLSQATIIEVREAQRSFEEAAFRLINLNYTAKLAEIELLRISNQLKP